MSKKRKELWVARGLGVEEDMCYAYDHEPTIVNGDIHEGFMGAVFDDYEFDMCYGGFEHLTGIKLGVGQIIQLKTPVVTVGSLWELIIPEDWE